jgi:hypothetical protein
LISGDGIVFIIDLCMMNAMPEWVHSSAIGAWFDQGTTSVVPKMSNDIGLQPNVTYFSKSSVFAMPNPPVILNVAREKTHKLRFCIGAE